MGSQDNNVVTRDYSDNISVKKFTVDELVPKYFPDIEPSLRNSGLIGMTTEQVSNISEDAFNSATVLFRETFPNRAQIPESIYSHAAIFQISDVFSTAASCNFLLVLEESAIIKNMQENYDKDSGIYYFYIGKNTKIMVTDIPFTLDYDVEMRIVKKTNDLTDSYLFSASYVTSEYNNSISSITDPYIKIRRSSDGYMALELKCHQCERVINYETIITNTVINYPIIDVKFEGKLAGFDILYKTETETSFNTQLTPLVVFSKPISTPFCYYQLEDDNTLRITFNTKDDYFQPEYGSEFQIILYITNGKDGEFDVYNGTNITIIPDDEKYTYASSYLTAAKPLTKSQGARDQASMDELQSLSVMGYRTANALTTEPDLSEYFNNYKYLYGDSEIKFIKKRNDLFERIYSAFILMKNNDYIYHTNTLSIEMNLGEMENPETNIYIMEPGVLFTANEYDGLVHFLRDEEKNKEYYEAYQQAIEDGTIDYITDNMDKSDLPAYLDRPASFAEYKLRNNLNDHLSVFDYKELDLDQYDDPSSNKFLLFNPFLIRFTKSPNLVSLYMTYIEQYSTVDFTSQNTDSYVQFIINTLHISRGFSKDKKYSFSLNVGPSISIGDQYPIVDGAINNRVMEYKLNDKFNVRNNDLRIFLVIQDSIKDICYTELYPTGYDKDTENFTFGGEIFTDDHVTSDGKLRILANDIYRNNSTGEYYKVLDNDFTFYNKYDKDGNILETNVPVDTVTELEHNGTVELWSNCVNMNDTDDILIPMNEVTCKIYMLYRRAYSDESGKLELLSEDATNNNISEYDESTKGYMWTNIYSTFTDPVTFLKPLNNVRSNLIFKDYTECTKVDGTNVFTYDIMDVRINSLPFIRWDMITDTDQLGKFMTLFLEQYDHLNEIKKTKLVNESSIDVKFYNTYGRSIQFRIGEDDENLDTVNLKLTFDIWFTSGTDLLSAIPEVKNYIKTQVEELNDSGTNRLYISNLMKKIELNFAYVDHIRFVGINNYDSTYQAVKAYVTDLDDLTVDERRVYVPELLVIDTDDIIINDYTAS